MRLAQSIAILLCATGSLVASDAGTSKTLVAWVIPANLSQRGGSVLTIQSGERFDAIVLGEKVRGRWMAGSDYFQRTQDNQHGYPAETADAETMVQIAIAYEGDEVRIYRNGERYAAYKTKNVDLLSLDNHIVVFGLRHVEAGGGTPFAGAIEDARIYPRALTAAEIISLKPNEVSKIDALAWWDFEGDKVTDRAGRFGHSVMTNGVKLANGQLVLDGRGYLVAARSAADASIATREDDPRAPTPPYVPQTPAWPENPPDNWLTFHLAHPGPGNAEPGDPNCAFDYKGRYHLHYIYRNHTGFVFAHVSSDDMLHWTWHTTTLAPPTTGHGMFSGTGFYTSDGNPAIIYHGEGSHRNWIQFPLDDQFDTWSEPVPMLPKTADGDVPDIRHWDPDCWLNGETYYALSGGENPQLMKSTDLEHWTHLGDLLHQDYPTNLGVAKDEDISCANMFQIGDKWMLLCISHGLGCRYYLGDFKDEKYLPESHAMMSFGSNMFFAPESMLTRDGRRVMWAWLLNAPVAPTGVQCLPRELELPQDGVLRIKPLRELQELRYDPQKWSDITIESDNEHALERIKGDALELNITFASPLPTECGINLFADSVGQGGISIIAGAGHKSLRVGTIEAPFEVRPGEDLRLRVFLDKNLVEVFANDRQAVVWAHRQIRENPNIRLFAKGGDALVESIGVWKIKTTYHAPAELQQVDP